MKARLTIFEDDRVEHLLPLAYLKAPFELRLGVSSLLCRIQRWFPDVRMNLIVRDYLAPLMEERYPGFEVNGEIDSSLLINGRAVSFDGSIGLEGPEEVWWDGDDVAAMRIGSDRSAALTANVFPSELLHDIARFLPVGTGTIRLARYPWDLVNENSQALRYDAAEMEGPSRAGFVDPSVVVYGSESALVVGSGSSIEAGVVVHVEDGPVLIGKNVTVRPPTIIQGPCAIGDNSIVDGAKIRPGCSFGPHCRVAGEVEASIFQGYVNKHHDGFLGHAFIGEWVNLGAGTTNSDLKNTYGNIKVPIAGELVDSGETKVGCFLGDHVKTGIGTLIDTGSVYGPFANVFGLPNVAPKEIASFSWGGVPMVPYDLERALKTARVVMGRRGVTMTDAYASAVRSVFERTEQDRVRLGVHPV
jgi:UDP-N-acetylglucosamine diphosphorylase/glucosamine-1-phosphate N-acetyltransferase